MKLKTGVNPYGLTYHLGLMGRGTPRANPNPVGLEGFIELTVELGGKAIELWDGWLRELGEDGLRALNERLRALDIVPVISSGLQHGDVDACLRYARELGADRIRFALTPVLCGDRAAAGRRWHELVAGVKHKLKQAAPKAADAGLLLLIENHQDFTSRELVDLCEEHGPSVRIVFDMANTFSTGESPLEFTRVIAPYVRYCHVKDYRVQFTEEGYRLVRCPSGDGCVPHKQMFEILARHHHDMLACIEVGALEARHVRLLTPGWWQGYANQPAEDLTAILDAARRNCIGDDEDWRTPWERNADHELVEYELNQYRRSVENMKAQGLM